MSASKAVIHSLAVVDPGAVVGHRSRVWAFAHILSGARIGEDCNICDHTFIESGVVLGDRVTVKCGVYLWSGLAVEDDVFIGPAVAFTNDLRPRSRQHPAQYSPTRLGAGCSLGANATLLPVRVGRYALVGAGAVVTKNVPDFALVLGNPARIQGWVCRCARKLAFTEGAASCNCGRNYRQISATHVEELGSIS